MTPMKEDSMVTGLVKVYALIWDQCSPTTKRELDQLPTYVAMNQNKNPVTLVTKMQNIVCRRETHRQPIYSMVQLIKKLSTTFQHKSESNEKYEESFKGMWD